MLELQHISWTAPGGNQVLRDVSLTIPEGKLTVITGPNGGGKTTLAKIIAGIETPDSGKILLDGQDITELDVTQRAKAGVSFAFQQPVRFKGFTVRRLLELSAGQKLPTDKLCEMLGRVGLCGREYINREVDATLSGGGTLIIISHQERILQIADEIVVISGGTLKEMGPGAEIFPRLMEGNVQCDACAKREAVFS